jgi:hypothetical protein
MMWYDCPRMEIALVHWQSELWQVLTTYAILESCFRKQQSGFKRKGMIIKEQSPMHQIRWSRIVVSSVRTFFHHTSALNSNICSSTKPITSKSVPPILRKPLSNWIAGISGAFQGHRCKTVLESCTVWSDFWMEILSLIIFVTLFPQIHLLRKMLIRYFRQKMWL